MPDEEQDFISLGGDADDTADFETTSDQEDEDSFNPAEMTLSTFHHLLEHYPATAEKVYRQKAINKAVPQPTKGDKKRAQRRAGTDEAVFRPPGEDDLDKSQKRYVDGETRKFCELSRWRFEAFPEVMRERHVSDNGRFMDKDEVLRVMEWKTKHGLPRPTLLGMLKTNKEKTVRETTTSAFAALPSSTSTTTTEDPPTDAFPKTSLDALSTPLRGVGPATASLILSIATSACDPAREIPFFSDDTFLWLCLEVYPRAPRSERRTRRLARMTKPNGELNVKYNLHEYRELWDAVWELRTRLNRAAGKTEAQEKGLRPVSSTDVEKVAFVIRHAGVAGVPVPEESEDDHEGEKENGDEEEKPKPKPKSRPKSTSKEKAKAKAKSKDEDKKRKRPQESAEEKKERKRKKYNNK